MSCHEFWKNAVFWHFINIAALKFRFVPPEDARKINNNVQGGSLVGGCEEMHVNIY